VIFDKQSPRAVFANSKRRTIGDVLVNTALVFATIICTLLAIEVGIRLHHRDWGFTNYRYPQASKFTGFHIYDAELGWVPKPERTSLWGQTVTILKGGIRSNGNGKVWDGTGEPILAVGDSYTFGDQVSDWQTWPAQLEQLSGRRVINAGVDGYGVDQAFLRAQRLLDRYRFSTVIFSFIPDDIRRSQMSVMFATAKPYFDFRDRRLTLENVPVPPPSVHPQKENVLLRVLEHSRLVNTVMERLFPEWWLRGASEKPVQDLQTAIKVSCALLDKLEGITKSHGTELIVLAQHWELEPASETREATRVLSCITDPATRIVDLESALAKIRAEHPVEYHQLYNPNLHMSAEGNQLVAHALLPIVESDRRNRRNQ
jgi:hypothetical protein